jgi:hypothetical protein
MNKYNRDLLVLLKTSSLSNEALEMHIHYLNKILLNVECSDAFCAAHELVTRFKITSSKKSILKAISYNQLKPFFFLINKN